MLEDRGCLPRKGGDVLREENFLGSWMREDVEGKEEERENVNKAAKEEARKREKERWREKGKGLRPKESVWILCPARFSRFSDPTLRWRVLEILGFFVVCALVVTLLFSDVNVDVVCEAVFSDSNCAFVKPQAFFFCLSRKREGSCGFGV